MADETAIDRLYVEATEVLRLLARDSEISLQVVAADHFRKALLLAAASFFEDKVCSAVLSFARECTNGSSLIENFIRNKAVERQYFTWFAWKESNANQFYGLFGADFKTAMIKQIEAAPWMRESVKAFMELGRERNKLVHQNYATFPMEKTMDEIYSLYQSALRFVDCLPEAMRTCDGKLKEASNRLQE